VDEEQAAISLFFLGTRTPIFTEGERESALSPGKLITENVKQDI